MTPDGSSRSRGTQTTTSAQGRHRDRRYIGRSTFATRRRNPIDKANATSPVCTEALLPRDDREEPGCRSSTPRTSRHAGYPDDPLIASISSTILPPDPALRYFGGVRRRAASGYCLEGRRLAEARPPRRAQVVPTGDGERFHDHTALGTLQTTTSYRRRRTTRQPCGRLLALLPSQPRTETLLSQDVS